MSLLLLLLLQEDGARPVEVPNAMAAHTWFVVIAVGAFLAWSISYSLQLQKEALKRKKGREDVARRKTELLNRIVELQASKDAGNITDQKYKQEMKALKFRLSKVLEKIGGKTGSTR